MILVVDLSWKPHSLSCSEFAGPVATIVDHAGRQSKIVHFSEIHGGTIEGAEGIILCGTALKDNRFASMAKEFSWLPDCPVPVLGICAGMQVLCQVFGGSVYQGCEIGMTEIEVVKTDPLFHEEKVFQAYELHSFASGPPDGWVITAVSDGYIQAVHHPARPIFGLMFHPEVRNEGFIVRFLSLCQEK
jgi:GMP synthase-like glutamine amidotransferase